MVGVVATACGGGQAQSFGTGTEGGRLHVTARTVLFGGSHLVRTVRTDANGRFEGRLPAGGSELRHLDTAADRICISPATVRVSAAGRARLPLLVAWTPLSPRSARADRATSGMAGHDARALRARRRRPTGARWRRAGRRRVEV